MSNKVGDYRAAAYDDRSFQGRRPLPKRGQIKSQIAANALHSVICVFSRVTSQQTPSNRKGYLKGMRNTRHT
ncbi:hypothetical protein AAC387_Pa08g0868 [Persea americana]